MKAKEPTHRSTKQQFVSLLRDFARQIQAMDDTQIEGILAGELRIEVRAPERERAKAREGKARCSDREIELLRRELQEAGSREQARVLIDRYLRSKADLVHFARVLDISAPQKSSSDDIKTRLVESTVGYRLRSAAIRGNLSAPPDSTGSSGSA